MYVIILYEIRRKFFPFPLKIALGIIFLLLSLNHVQFCSSFPRFFSVLFKEY